MRFTFKCQFKIFFKKITKEFPFIYFTIFHFIIFYFILFHLFPPFLPPSLSLSLSLSLHYWPNLREAQRPNKENVHSYTFFISIHVSVRDYVIRNRAIMRNCPDNITSCGTSKTNKLMQ